MTDEVFIDWDVDFKGWSRIKDRPERKGVVPKRSREWVKGRIRRWRHLVGIGVPGLRMAYRRSSGGRVHVRIVLRGVPTPPVRESDFFLLRYILLDDPDRLWLDLVRHERGERTNRLFETKYKGGVLRQAGPWKDWA